MKEELADLIYHVKVIDAVNNIRPATAPSQLKERKQDYATESSVTKLAQTTVKERDLDEMMIEDI